MKVVFLGSFSVVDPHVAFQGLLPVTRLATDGAYLDAWVRLTVVDEVRQPFEAAAALVRSLVRVDDCVDPQRLFGQKAHVARVTGE